jgi:WD40 repeat protein
VTCLAFSPRGDLLASGYHSGAIRLWDLHALSEREVFALASACVGSVTDLAFSPDGLLLASVGADKALRLWETKALCEQPSSKAVDLLAATRPLGTVANALAYVRSGSWIALACADRTLRVRDGLTGAVVIEGEAKGRAEIAEAPQASTNMAASPDGSLLAVAGQDKTIRVFSVEPLAEMRRLAGHAKAVTGVCFFPDGRRIASVARENRVILWDVDKGTASATLWGGGDEVFVGVAVLDGGRRVAAGLSDTRVRVWATEAG